MSETVLEIHVKDFSEVTFKPNEVIGFLIEGEPFILVGKYANGTLTRFVDANGKISQEFRMVPLRRLESYARNN